MADPVRVQKAISAAGLMSRRKAEEAIAAGRVEIDGTVAILGDRVDLNTQRVLLDGVELPVRPDLETHLLYKPVGVLSTASDPGERRTVVDLVPSSARLYPVGRLDADSEGLILISNDGELTNLVTHPRYGITKKYIVLVKGSPGRAEMRRLTDGIMLHDGLARALEAKVIEASPHRTLVAMTMGEGRNREIRRMMEELDLEVLRLVRTAIGPISDRSLESGMSRRLQPTEVLSIYRAAKK